MNNFVYKTFFKPNARKVYIDFNHTINMSKTIYKGPAIGLYDPANFQRFMEQMDDMDTLRTISRSGSRLFGVYFHNPSGVKVYYLAGLNSADLQPTAQVATLGNDTQGGELERRIRISAIVDHPQAILQHIFDLVREAD